MVGRQKAEAVALVTRKHLHSRECLSFRVFRAFLFALEKTIQNPNIHNNLIHWFMEQQVCSTELLEDQIKNSGMALQPSSWRWQSKHWGHREIPSPDPVVSCHWCRAAEDLQMDLIEVYLQAHVLPSWQQSWDTQSANGELPALPVTRRRWAHCWGFKWINAASLQFHIRVQAACRSKSIPAMLTGSNQDKGKTSQRAQLGVLSNSQTAGSLPLFPPPLDHLPNNKDF